MFVVGRVWCALCDPEKKMDSKQTFVAQEGGDHYQAEYQHWDWVTDIGMTYLPATATKYLTRWRKKNGLQDLIKSQTYLEKLIVTWDTVFQFTVEPPEAIDEMNARFIKSNGLNYNSLEARICFLLSDLGDSNGIFRIHEAKSMLSELIAEAHGSAG